jgi:hypothetical protein
VSKIHIGGVWIRAITMQGGSIPVPTADSLSD